MNKKNVPLFTQIIGGIIASLNSLGLHSFAWPLRRLYTNVDREALVLEVGSGGNPYPRSNVLLDAFEETRERHWEPLRKDRPTVIGFAENLPFGDKSFDYVIACHVLEHSDNPAQFLSELQRVAKAGYIEVPNALFERICPYIDHKLEILNENEKLIITKKSGSVHDRWFNRSFKDDVNSAMLRLFRKNPYMFHVCFEWRDSFHFRIENPDQLFLDRIPPTPFTIHKLGFAASIKRFVLTLLSRLSKGNVDPKDIDLKGRLRCPDCKNAYTSSPTQNEILCTNCGAKLKIFLPDSRSFSLKPTEIGI